MGFSFFATYISSSVKYLFMSVDNFLQIICFFTAEFGGLELCSFIGYRVTAAVRSVKVTIFCESQLAMRNLQ